MVMLGSQRSMPLIKLGVESTDGRVVHAVSAHRFPLPILAHGADGWPVGQILSLVISGDGVVSAMCLVDDDQDPAAVLTADLTGEPHVFDQGRRLVFDRAEVVAAWLSPRSAFLWPDIL